MNKHKQKCETLRKIRIAIAEKLGIKGKIKEEPCNFDGECKGTCPACQKEENMLKEAMTNNKDIKTETRFSNENFGQTMGLVSIPVNKTERHIANDDTFEKMKDTFGNTSDAFNKFSTNFGSEKAKWNGFGTKTFGSSNIKFGALEDIKDLDNTKEMHDIDDIEDDVAFGEIDDYEDELTGIDEPWDDNEESTENTSNNKEK